MNYNVCDFSVLKRAAKIGEKYRGRDWNKITEAELADEIIYYDLGEEAYLVALAAVKYDITFEVKTWYRVGEPCIDYMAQRYNPSYNYAEGHYEAGVSVCSEQWLHSMKSMFSFTDTRVLRGRGIWEIRGFQIGAGGDDEPLIFPVDWAKRLRVYSRAALEKLVCGE